MTTVTIKQRVNGRERVIYGPHLMNSNKPDIVGYQCGLLVGHYETLGAPTVGWHIITKPNFARYQTFKKAYVLGNVQGRLGHIQGEAKRNQFNRMGEIKPILDRTVLEHGVNVSRLVSERAGLDTEAGKRIYGLVLIGRGHIEEFDRQKAAQSRRIAQLEEEVSEIRDRYRGLQDNADSDASSAYENLQNARRDQQMHAAAEELQEINEVMRALDEQKQINQRLMEQLTAAAVEDDDYRGLAEELRRVKAENRDLDDQHRNLLRAYDDLNKALGRAEEAQKRQQMGHIDEMRANEDIINGLKQMIQDAAAKKQRFEAQIQQQEGKLDDLRREIHFHKANYAALQESSSRSNGDLQQQVDEAKSQLEEARRGAAQGETDAGRRVIDLEQEVADLNERLHEQEVRERKSGQRAADAKLMQGHLMEAQQSKHQEEMAAKEAEIERAQQAYNDVEKLLNDSRIAEARASEAHKEAFHQLQVERAYRESGSVQTLRQRNDDVKAYVDGLLRRHGIEVQGLQVRAENAEWEANDYHKKLQDSRAELARMVEAYAALENRRQGHNPPGHSPPGQAAELTAARQELMEMRKQVEELEALASADKGNKAYLAANRQLKDVSARVVNAQAEAVAANDARVRAEGRLEAMREQADAEKAATEQKLKDAIERARANQAAELAASQLAESQAKKRLGEVEAHRDELANQLQQSIANARMNSHLDHGRQAREVVEEIGGQEVPAYVNMPKRAGPRGPNPGARIIGADSGEPDASLLRQSAEPKPGLVGRAVGYAKSFFPNAPVEPEEDEAAPSGPRRSGRARKPVHRYGEEEPPKQEPISEDYRFLMQKLQPLQASFGAAATMADVPIDIKLNAPIKALMVEADAEQVLYYLKVWLGIQSRVDSGDLSEEDGRKARAAVHEDLAVNFVHSVIKHHQEQGHRGFMPMLQRLVDMNLEQEAHDICTANYKDVAKKYGLPELRGEVSQQIIERLAREGHAAAMAGNQRKADDINGCLRALVRQIEGTIEGYSASRGIPMDEDQEEEEEEEEEQPPPQSDDADMLSDDEDVNAPVRGDIGDHLLRQEEARRAPPRPQEQYREQRPIIDSEEDEAEAAPRRSGRARKPVHRYDANLGEGLGLKGGALGDELQNPQDNAGLLAILQKVMQQSALPNSPALGPTSHFKKIDTWLREIPTVIMYNGRLLKTFFRLNPHPRPLQIFKDVNVARWTWAKGPQTNVNGTAINTGDEDTDVRINRPGAPAVKTVKQADPKTYADYYKAETDKAKKRPFHIGYDSRRPYGSHQEPNQLHPAVIPAQRQWVPRVVGGQPPQRRRRHADIDNLEFSRQEDDNQFYSPLDSPEEQISDDEDALPVSQPLPRHLMGVPVGRYQNLYPAVPDADGPIFPAQRQPIPQVVPEPAYRFREPEIVPPPDYSEYPDYNEFYP